MSEVMARIGLIQLQVQRNQQRCNQAVRENDLEGVRACRREMEVLLESMRAIREEQLLAELERSRPKSKKRRWWQKRDAVGPEG